MRTKLSVKKVTENGQNFLLLLCGKFSNFNFFGWVFFLNISRLHSLMTTYQMNLISAGSMSPDSTFKLQRVCTFGIPGLKWFTLKRVMMPRAHSLVNGSSSLKKGISVDSLLEKIPVNSDTRVGTLEQHPTMLWCTLGCITQKYSSKHRQPRKTGDLECCVSLEWCLISNYHRNMEKVQIRPFNFLVHLFTKKIKTLWASHRK